MKYLQDIHFMKKILGYLFAFIMFCNIGFADNLSSGIASLKKLFDDGVLTEEEFNKAKGILIKKYEEKDKKADTKEGVKTASLPKKTEPDKKESLGEGIISTQTNEVRASNEWEKMEVLYKGYRIYTCNPGCIKIRRVSDNKQLVTVSGNLKVKYKNGGENLFDITKTEVARPSAAEELAKIGKLPKKAKKILKNPFKFVKQQLTPRKLKKKKGDEGFIDFDEDTKEERKPIKLELRLDGVKILHMDGRYVSRFKAFFYQVFTSGYKPFHFYITLPGRTPISLNMKKFNTRIDKAIRKAKTRLAQEFDVTEAQIDKIIEEQTGQATEEASQEAIAEAVSAEVQAAVEQSIGEEMSAGVISAIEQATGEAIDEALEQELAAAIDAEIAAAVAMGIEEAAVAAGWQAYFDVLVAGGTDAQASAAAYEACGSACENY